MPPCRQCNSAVLRPGRSAYPSGPVDVGPQHRIGPDQQDCTHSCRGRCQALQSSSSAPLFESPARLSRREGGAGHSISFPLRLEEIARAKALDCDTIEIWFADEARIGQKNKITRRWAKRGSRPSARSDQRTASTYIFGAICPKEGKAVGLILPWCNTATMSLQLAAISADVAPGRHAVLLLDQAGWHLSQKLVVPSNITIVPLPAKCPELNPQENVWQFMRDNWLSNRVFENARALVDHCYHAWNKLEAQPWLIMSIGMRGWAHRF